MLVVWGVTSAVACKVAIDHFGLDRCLLIMIDTKNEDEDTYRFRGDCEAWYGDKIYSITNIGNKYQSVQEVWRKHKSLNVATGAVCSTMLKRKAREDWQKVHEFTYQVFGFEFEKKEMNRALGLSVNHPNSKPIFPLLMFGYNKKDCIRIIEQQGIDIPRMYKYGFINNNCFRTGCVQGGVGYWQKMQREYPDKFDEMAAMEHELTCSKGMPVTMLKSQSKADKAKVVDGWENFVFLKRHPLYPQLKCIDDMPQCKVEPLFECNGFCGVNDLSERNKSEFDINFSTI